ncbi:hypothetical protein PQO03_08825 [Lentisphaera profundi]|uniref:Uncharacterized protein n=1 Tax=Lentisphaera profundi TaxID=1658616 RepID=A0ABY7VSE6_9BACT|nr:hypothetical protein [Lentisphaera profundi]WDE95817.1 hypothetical protein PQO03_08825 [Lentisphaera profundi]
MALIIVILVLILGLNILIGGIKGLIRSQNSKSWPHLDVEIIKSEVKETPPTRHNKLPTYEPDIEFQFEYHTRGRMGCIR